MDDFFDFLTYTNASSAKSSAKRAERASKEASKNAQIAAAAYNRAAAATAEAERNAQIRHQEILEQQRQQRLQEAQYQVQQMGDIENPCALGNQYYSGNGCVVDEFLAFNLYQLAYNRGDEWSAYNMAVMYERGQAVNQNANLADEYYQKYVEMAFQKYDRTPDEWNDVALGFEQGSNGWVQNKVVAFYIFRRAADLKSKYACYNLARYYSDGIAGVTIDKSIARQWAEQAIAYGNNSAFWLLGSMWKDDKETIDWAKIAAVECNNEDQRKEMLDGLKNRKENTEKQIAFAKKILKALVVAVIVVALFLIYVRRPMMIIAVAVVALFVFLKIRSIVNGKKKFIAFLSEPATYKGYQYIFHEDGDNSYVETRAIA